MSEETTGALGGAAQGAAYGTMIMPGIGTAVGAVVGAIGGYLTGSKSRASRIAGREAKKIERELSYRGAAKNRRDMYREARILRAQSVAAGATQEGGLESSPVRGAISSLGAQLGSNARYFDWRIGKFVKMQEYVDKAGKYAAQAGQISGLMSSLFSAASMYSAMKPTPTPTGGYTATTLAGSQNVLASGASPPSTFGQIPGIKTGP